jgi:hypothetical protein
MCFERTVSKLSFWSLLAICVMNSTFLVQDAKAFSFEKAGFQITAEPVVGYEWTQVPTPVWHTRGMLIYGARFVVGHRWLSGEGEYTLGTTNETFPTQDQNIKADKQNARLGLRSSKSVGPFVDFLFRAGGQATKTEITTTTISTATSLTDGSDWEIHPYAGLGLQANVLKIISISLEATYLFRNLKDWSGNDVQTSASLKIQLPH